MTKLCETCKWFVAEVSVCTNADSRHCADFVGKYCGSENAVEYRDLKARQAKAYRKEYYKALTREEPQIGDNTKYGNPFFKIERRVNTDGALWQ